MSGNAVLSGDLGFISLADCFQILGGNNSTGTLHITSPYVSNPGMIFFVDGNPVNASNGPLRGLNAIYPLFGWSEGAFEFYEEAVLAEQAVNSSRMEVVLEALRMLDDGLIERVGPTCCSEIAGAENGSKRGSDVLPVIRGPLPDYMYVIDEEEFHDGVKIVTEGGHGNWIWVILEGMVEMTRNTSKGTMYIAKLGEGSFIGSLTSFFQRDYIRNASVSAVGDIQLGVLDTQRLYKEYARLSSDFKALIISLDGRLGKITNKAVTLFENGNAVDNAFEDSQMVLNEGNTDRDVFSITRGTAHVIRKGANGNQPLLCLSEGDIFGNLPFIDVGHEPRSASVVGSQDLELNRLDPETFERQYSALSQTIKNMLDNTCTCVSMTTRIALHLLDQKTSA